MGKLDEKLNLRKAVLITDMNGPDRLYLTFNFPSGIYPFKGLQVFETSLAAGQGQAWSDENGIVLDEVVEL